MRGARQSRWDLRPAKEVTSYYAVTPVHTSSAHLSAQRMAFGQQRIRSLVVHVHALPQERQEVIRQPGPRYRPRHVRVPARRRGQTGARFSAEALTAWHMLCRRCKILLVRMRAEACAVLDCICATLDCTCATCAILSTASCEGLIPAACAILSTASCEGLIPATCAILSTASCAGLSPAFCASLAVQASAMLALRLCLAWPKQEGQ